jgi:AcrR family transcriptional regulator
MPTDPPPGRRLRADAERNREQLLAVARVVVAEQGTGASLRDIARRAGVGLATLYRHFPTREVLLEELLHEGFRRLAARADVLADELPPREALETWFRDLVDGAGRYPGMSGDMMRSLNDPTSPLWASCAQVHEAGGRLLTRAQAAGTVRPDVTGDDLFTLVGAATWVGGQGAPAADRLPRFLSVLLDGLRPA